MRLARLAFLAVLLVPTPLSAAPMAATVASAATPPAAVFAAPATPPPTAVPAPASAPHSPTPASAPPARAPVPGPHAAVWDSLTRLQSGGRWGASDTVATALVAQLEHEPGVDSLELSRALLYVAQARYRERLLGDDLVGIVERSLALRDRHARPGDALHAWSHNWAAKFYADLGRNEDALRHARATLRLDAARVPPDSQWVSEDHLSLALALHALGHDDEARGEYLSAIEIREGKFGPRAPLMVPVLAEYGQFRSDLGDFDGARAWLERARTIAEPTNDPTSDRLEGVLARLTTLELRVGNLAESVELAQRSYELAAARSGEDGVQTLRARTRLAYRLSEFGDHAAAAARLRELLPAFSAQLGPTHPQVLNARLSYLEDAFAIGDTSGARAELAALAPAVRAADLRTNSNSLLIPLLSSELQRLAGDFAGARALLEAGVDSAWSRRTVLAAPLATALDYELRTLRGPDDRGVAEPILARIERLRDSTSVRATPAWITLLGGRAQAEARLGMRDAAWRDAQLAAAAAGERLRFQAQALPDHRALQLAGELGAPTDALVRLARDGTPAQVRDAWDEVVRWRGLVRGEVSARRLAASAAADTAVAGAHARWLAAQRRLAQLVVSGAAHPGDPESAARYEAGRREAEEAERGFMRRLGAHPGDSVSLARVLDRLPGGAALVSFVTSDIDAGDRSLGAFVVGAGERTPRYVELGDLEALRGAIRDWTERLGVPPSANAVAARAAERACRERGAAVRARVWDPILRALGGAATEIFVVPEGPAWDVPWLALPQGATGYLADEPYTVRVLNAERELLLAAPPAGRGLLAVGGADFDCAPSTGAAEAPIAGLLRSHPWPCASGRAEPLPPLPAARAEAEAIAALWRATPAAGGVELLVGAEPDERVFKRDAPGRAVIHLATHGIEVRDTCASRAGGGALRGVGGIAEVAGAGHAAGARRETARPKPAAKKSGADGASTPHASTPAKAPATASPSASAAAGLSTSPGASRWLGHRVWLALAGANAPLEQARDENEGLLTDEEVATLDLSGTDWVVLSACHSGAGESWAHEGELGMRRAFHLAGARAVIASRWAVADDATREWMLGLYAARLRGECAGAAVRSAARSALAERRRQGRSTHPFFWAGFEATGP